MFFSQFLLAPAMIWLQAISQTTVRTTAPVRRFSLPALGTLWGSASDGNMGVSMCIYNYTARTDVLPGKVRFDCAGPMFCEIPRVVRLGKRMTIFFSLISSTSSSASSSTTSTSSTSSTSSASSTSSSSSTSSTSLPSFEQDRAPNFLPTRPCRLYCTILPSFEHPVW